MKTLLLLILEIVVKAQTAQTSLAARVKALEDAASEATTAENSLAQDPAVKALLDQAAAAPPGPAATPLPSDGFADIPPVTQ